MGIRLNQVINAALLISFLILFITGLIKHPALVRYLIGIALPMGQISSVHDAAGVITGILGIIHIILNWRFWKSLFRKRGK